MLLNVARGNVRRHYIGWIASAGGLFDSARLVANVLFDPNVLCIDAPELPQVMLVADPNDRLRVSADNGTHNVADIARKLH